MSCPTRTGPGGSASKASRQPALATSRLSSSVVSATLADMGQRGCTVNVGSGPGGSPRRTEAMRGWAQRVLRDPQQPVVVFAQEVSDAWLQVWEDAGYRIYLGQDRGWRIRSALITAPGMHLEALPEGAWSNAWYHGSYLAARVWTDAPGGPVVLCSVHASPQPARPSMYGWEGPLPRVRNGGGDPRWTGGRLWDSDLVADSLIELSRFAPVLAGGDFNEARLDVHRDDHGETGTWGHEYFQRLERAGLREVTLRGGREAYPTRAGLQLDHVLTTEAARVRLGLSRPRLDAAWRRSEGKHLSDHAALWFSLRV